MSKLKEYLIVYQTENGILGNIEMEFRQKTYRSDSYSDLIEAIRQKISEEESREERGKTVILNIILLNDVFK